MRSTGRPVLGGGPRTKLVASSLLALALGLAPLRAHAAKPSAKDAPHAHGVDLAGEDHGEPKLERGEVVVRASAKRAAARAEVKRGPYEDLPALPTPELAPSERRAAGAAKKAASEKAAVASKKEGTSSKDASKKSAVASSKDAPKKDAPKKDAVASKKSAVASSKDAPKKDAPKKDAPKKDAPKKDARKEVAAAAALPKEEILERVTQREKRPPPETKSAGVDKGSPAEASKRPRTASAREEPARARNVAASEDATAGKDKAAKKTAPPPPKPTCMKDPVEVVRGPEVERFALLTCDGEVAPLAIERLSILVRPGAAPRPVAPLAELAKKPGAELAPGIRRVDPRLVPRIQAIAERFAKPDLPTRLFIISGYRPASVGSMHSTGRAIDFRVEGAANEDVVTFCKTLEDTGCGYYPNSSFVHIDVRDAGAGHVSWIDVSGPGEPPRYVSSWPPPPPPAPAPAASEHVFRASATEPSSSLAEEGERLLRATRPVELENGEEDPHADLAP